MTKTKDDGVETKWPAEALEKLETLARNFPTGLQKGFKDVFLKGEECPELDDYLESEEGKTREGFLLDALHIQGEVTLGHSRSALAEAANSLRSPIEPTAIALKTALDRHAFRLEGRQATQLEQAMKEAELDPRSRALLSELFTK